MEIRPFSEHWLLDSSVDFLNHGSYGATPRRVLEYQQELQRELESEPIDFLCRRLESRLDSAREILARFLGCDAEGLAFVPNATAGVNTIMRSLDLTPVDEIVLTSFEYNATRNAVLVTGERTGAQVKTLEIAFPGTTPESVIATVEQGIGPRTKLVVLDHITSQTALVLPIEKIVSILNARGIPTLIDGAHAPGMIPLSLATIGATYYTGNCHKWVCAPKGSAFLWVNEEKRSGIRPLAISHGANAVRPGRSRFRLEFDWLGTHDPTAYLSVPVALSTMEALRPGGWPEIYRLNRELALTARKTLATRLGAELPCQDSMIGSMATVRYGEGDAEETSRRLREEYRIDPLVFNFPATPFPAAPFSVSPSPAAPARWIRISAQLYNSPNQYERLADSLLEINRRPA